MCKFVHFRAVGEDDNSIASRGGASAAFEEKDGEIYVAISFCSDDDNFNFRYGRAKASGRLTQLQQKPELVDGFKYHIIDKEEVEETGLVKALVSRIGDAGYYHLFHPGTGLYA